MKWPRDGAPVPDSSGPDGEGAGSTTAHRVAGCIALMSVAVAIPATLLVDSRVGAALTESHAHRLEAVAQNMAQSLTQGLSGWVRDAWALSRTPVIRDPAVSGEDKRAALEDFKYRYPEFVWAGYIDAPTGLVLAATDGMEEGVSAAGQPLFEEGRRGSYVGPVHEVPHLAQTLPPKNEISPRRFVDVAVPVLGGKGATLGVVAGILEWGWAERIRARTQAPGIEAFVMDLSGKVILGGSGPEAQALPPRLSELTADEGAIRMRWPDAGEQLTTVAPAAANGLYPALGWKVIAHEPMREINAAARRIREWVALICVSIGVAAALIVLFALRGGRSVFQARRARYDLLAAERNARSAAERAARLKDEFIGKLSHELRTPLNAILGWSQLLESGRLDGAGIKLAMETIRRNVTAQVLLLQNLLDMSRIESGRLRLCVKRVDLEEIAREAVATLRQAIDAKRMRVRITPTEGDCAIDGDPARLTQIVNNLLSNALRFTADEGCVQLKLQRNAQRVELEVSDSGRGVDAAEMEKIFTRYKQPGAVGPSSQGGLGLGLAVAKSLAELHGGSLRVRSEGQGKGAIFTLSLPAAVLAETASDVPIAVTSAAVVRLDGVRVLVIDDEPDALDLIARCLGDQGADVVLARSAAEAMECLCWKGPFNVLVSDLGMPGEDGMSLLLRVRAMPVFRDLPAIAVTAYAREVDRRTALDAGYQAHIGKPVEAATLIAEIARLVLRPQQERRAVA